MYTARRQVQLKAIKSDWKPQLGRRVSISTSPPTPTPPFLFRSATALCRCLPSFAQSRAPLRHPSIPSSAPHMGAHVQPAYVRQVRQLFGGEHRKRVGGEIRSLSVWRSAGTSRVSRCLSAIKANELFHFVVSLVEKHSPTPPRNCDRTLYVEE